MFDSDEFEFELINTPRWLTNVSQTHTILADQVTEILIEKVKKQINFH